MDKTPSQQQTRHQQPRRGLQWHSPTFKLFASALAMLLVGLSTSTTLSYIFKDRGKIYTPTPMNAKRTLERCNVLHLTPGPPPDFYERTVSDRYEPGTKPVLIRNATIWTGRVNGQEVIKGDLFLDKGIIKAVGEVPVDLFKGYGGDLIVIDAEEA